MKTWDTVAIVGVGLIGASIGLALRKRKLARDVVGIGRRATSLRLAKRRGAVTRTTTDLGSGVGDAQLIVVCTPVEAIPEHVRAVALACRKGAFITDAGSTKEEIVACLDRTLAQHNPRQAAFVGSHPMAGSEKSGPQHARADLFDDEVAVVTPSAQTNPRVCRAIVQFWRSLGARVIQMGPTEHDQAVAAISHLPHVVASALAAATSPDDLPLAARGWKDTTRIAAGDPVLWRQILTQNRNNVLQALNKFREELEELRRSLDENDGAMMEKLLQKGRDIRAQVTRRRGLSGLRT